MKPELLEIALMGRKILRQVAEPVPVEEIESEEMQKLIKDLTFTMEKKDGLGLAAPQVFKSLRIFVVNAMDAGDGNYPQIFINPRVKPIGNKKKRGYDGCLSLPGLYGYTRRYNKVKVSYLNEQGEKLSGIFSNLMARVIQHEFDHLEGVLWIDRVDSNDDIYCKGVKRE